jgi:hypothetical protein
MQKLASLMAVLAITWAGLSCLAPAVGFLDPNKHVLSAPGFLEMNTIREL